MDDDIITDKYIDKLAYKISKELSMKKREGLQHNYMTSLYSLYESIQDKEGNTTYSEHTDKHVHGWVGDYMNLLCRAMISYGIRNF